MSHRGFQFAAAAASALTAFALAVPALATSPPARAVRPAPAAASQQVMLPTGDLVTVSARPGGPRTVAIAPAQRDGAAAQFLTFTAGGDLYVVPESAAPDLGTRLSPALFDVTRLAQAERGRQQLTVRLRRPSGQQKTVRLNLAAARAFGATLARSGRRPVAGLASMSPAFAAAPAPAAGKDTLTVHGINAAGKADSGDMFTLYNVDNLKKYDSYATFKDGTATVQVPPGHYDALCFFYDQATLTAYEATDAQFTVSGKTSITLDARKATSTLSVATPKTSTAKVTTVGVGRGAVSGGVAPFSFIGNGAISFKVQPVTSGVTVGKLYYYVYTRRYSPAKAASTYTYDLEFPATGSIPANQHYTAGAGSLATIPSSYPAGRSGQQSGDARFAALSWQDVVGSTDTTFTTPTRRTEYYSAGSAVTWSGSDYQVFNLAQGKLQGELDSSWASYHAGQQLPAATWGGSPAQPRLLQTPVYIGQTDCPACLTGSKLSLLVFPFADSTPDQRGYPDSAATGLTESESWRVSADGQQAAQGTGFLNTAVILPTNTKQAGLSYDTSRSSAAFPLSTSVATSWTVPTSAAVKLPPAWVCGTSGTSRDCTVLPLLYANYQLPTSLTGQIPAGTAKATLTLGHLAGADIALHAVTLSVSYDGGKTWSQAKVTSAGGGRYTATFAVPAQAKTNGYGELKLTASDAKGGTLSQTTTRAFAVTGS